MADEKRKRRTYFTQAQKEEFLKKIEKGVQEGLSIQAAVIALGFRVDQYYRWKRRMTLPEKKSPPNERITLIAPERVASGADQVTVILGHEESVFRILSQLVKLKETSSSWKEIPR